MRRDLSRRREKCRGNTHLMSCLFVSFPSRREVEAVYRWALVLFLQFVRLLLTPVGVTEPFICHVSVFPLRQFSCTLKLQSSSGVFSLGPFTHLFCKEPEPGQEEQAFPAKIKALS